MDILRLFILFIPGLILQFHLLPLCSISSHLDQMRVCNAYSPAIWSVLLFFFINIAFPQPSSYMDQRLRPTWEGLGCSTVAERWPSMCKALNSIPCTGGWGEITLVLPYVSLEHLLGKSFQSVVQCLRTENVAHWQSTCLGCMRPWVQSSTPKSKTHLIVQCLLYVPQLLFLLLLPSFNSTQISLLHFN